MRNISQSQKPAHRTLDYLVKIANSGLLAELRDFHKASSSTIEYFHRMTVSITLLEKGGVLEKTKDGHRLTDAAIEWLTRDRNEVEYNDIDLSEESVPKSTEVPLDTLGLQLGQILFHIVKAEGKDEVRRVVVVHSAQKAGSTLTLTAVDPLKHPQPPFRWTDETINLYERKFDLGMVKIGTEGSPRLEPLIIEEGARTDSTYGANLNDALRIQGFLTGAPQDTAIVRAHSEFDLATKFNIRSLNLFKANKQNLGLVSADFWRHVINGSIRSNPTQVLALPQQASAIIPEPIIVKTHNPDQIVIPADEEEKPIKTKRKKIVKKSVAQKKDSSVAVVRESSLATPIRQIFGEDAICLLDSNLQKTVETLPGIPRWEERNFISDDAKYLARIIGVLPSMSPKEEATILFDISRKSFQIKSAEREILLAEANRSLEGVQNLSVKIALIRTLTQEERALKLPEDLSEFWKLKRTSHLKFAVLKLWMAQDPTQLEFDVFKFADAHNVRHIEIINFLNREAGLERSPFLPIRIGAGKIHIEKVYAGCEALRVSPFSVVCLHEFFDSLPTASSGMVLRWVRSQDESKLKMLEDRGIFLSGYHTRTATLDKASSWYKELEVPMNEAETKATLRIL